MNESDYWGIKNKRPSNYIKAAIIEDFVNIPYIEIADLSIKYGIVEEIIASLIEKILLNPVRNPMVIALKSKV